MTFCTQQHFARTAKSTLARPISPHNSSCPQLKRGLAMVQSANTSQASKSKPLKGDCIVKLTSQKVVQGTVLPLFGDDNNLTTYMSQAAENFANISLPMGGKITKVDNTHVELVVPKIQIFDVWLQPRAVAALSTFPDGKRIEFESNTENVGLDGSHHVQTFRLDERFNLDVRITFLWSIRGGSSSNSTDSDSQGNASGTDSESEAQPMATITANGTLTIEVDIPPPFSFMPKDILTGAGNTAVAGVMSIILNSFVGSLTRDYAIWASDPQLRNKRLLASKTQPAAAAVIARRF